jgi:hypothetical protein
MVEVVLLHMRTPAVLWQRTAVHAHRPTSGLHVARGQYIISWYFLSVKHYKKRKSFVFLELSVVLASYLYFVFKWSSWVFVYLFVLSRNNNLWSLILLRWLFCALLHLVVCRHRPTSHISVQPMRTALHCVPSQKKAVLIALRSSDLVWYSLNYVNRSYGNHKLFYMQLLFNSAYTHVHV